MEAHEVWEGEFTVWEMVRAQQCVNNLRPGSIGESKLFTTLSRKLELNDVERAAVGWREGRERDGALIYGWNADAPTLHRKMRGELVNALSAVVQTPPMPLFTVAEAGARRALLEKLGASAEDLAALFGGDDE